MVVVVGGGGGGLQEWGSKGLEGPRIGGFFSQNL